MDSCHPFTHTLQGHSTGTGAIIYQPSSSGHGCQAMCTFLNLTNISMVVILILTFKKTWLSGISKKFTTTMTWHDGSGLICGHYGNLCYWVSHGHLSDKWCPCLIPFSIVSVIDLYCPWQMCHNEPMSFAHWHISQLISPGINPCHAEFILRDINIFAYSFIC